MLTAKTLVEGLYGGGHVSPRQGPGITFHDYRQYVPGDDLAAVDWKLYGRTDRHYIRRYQHHTDLHAHLLVDMSASMAFAGLTRTGRPITNSKTTLTKFQYAQQVAAALGYLLVKQSDRVGLATCDDKLREVLPTAGTWAHLQQLCTTLETARPTRPGDLKHCLQQLHALIRRRNMVVILSDLLDPLEGLFDGLNRLRHDRCEVVVLQVLTPQELDLAQLGNLRLKMVDYESRAQVATHVPAVTKRYRQLFDAHQQALRTGCAARGVEYHLLRTDKPIVESLRHWLGNRN